MGKIRRCAFLNCQNNKPGTKKYDVTFFRFPENPDRLRNRTESESSRCSICFESFSSVDYLLQHSNRKHTKISQVSMGTPENHYRCHLCGMKFYLRSQFLNHEITVHEGIIRDSTSVEASFLEDLEKYACTDCDQKFISRWQLDSHVKKEHLATWEEKLFVNDLASSRCEVMDCYITEADCRLGLELIKPNKDRMINPTPFKLLKSEEERVTNKNKRRRQASSGVQMPKIRVTRKSKMLRVRFPFNKK